MGCCLSGSYSLPTLRIIGGETKEQIFDVFYDETGQPMQLSGFDCRFCIASNLIDSPTPIINKAMSVTNSETTGYNNALMVKLDPSDTVELNGKYIYQISLYKATENISSIFQGVMYVKKNINLISFT